MQNRVAIAGRKGRSQTPAGEVLATNMAIGWGHPADRKRGLWIARRVNESPPALAQDTAPKIDLQDIGHRVGSSSIVVALRTVDPNSPDRIMDVVLTASLQDIGRRVAPTSIVVALRTVDPNSPDRIMDVVLTASLQDIGRRVGPSSIAPVWDTTLRGGMPIIVRLGIASDRGMSSDRHVVTSLADNTAETSNGNRPESLAIE